MSHVVEFWQREAVRHEPILEVGEVAHHDVVVFTYEMIN